MKFVYILSFFKIFSEKLVSKLEFDGKKREILFKIFFQFDEFYLLQGGDVCENIKNQNRPPTCSETDQFCQLNLKNKEELPKNCVETCSLPGQSEICSSLVRATQYNTKLMGQNGGGIPNFEAIRKHKLEQQEDVNEDDILQAPKVTDVAKDDVKGNFTFRNASFS